MCKRTDKALHVVMQASPVLKEGLVTPHPPYVVGNCHVKVHDQIGNKIALESIDYSQHEMT